MEARMLYNISDSAASTFNCSGWLFFSLSLPPSLSLSSSLEAVLIKLSLS